MRRLALTFLTAALAAAAPHVTRADDVGVNGVLERFRTALLAEGIEARFAGGAPRRVSFDPDALEQVLENLLSNVRKYAPRSGIVEVSSRQDDETTTIIVADRGPGIPERCRSWKPR